MWGGNAGQQPRKVWKELELRGGGGCLEDSQDQNDTEQLFLSHVTSPQLLLTLALSASGCSRWLLPHLGGAFPPFAQASPPQASTFIVSDSHDSLWPQGYPKASFSTELHLLLLPNFLLPSPGP